MKTIITSLIILSAAFASAQTGSISGRVIDSQTLEPLPFTNVFINNTTIGTSTNTNGEFTLKNVPAGTSEVIYSFVGYQSYQVKVAVKEGEVVKAIVRLIPLENQLAEVQVNESRDKVWEKQLKKFEKIFLGNNEIARECKITNPWVIDFPSAGDNVKFSAVASAPIDIQNLAMGYHITYYLKDFWSDGVHYSIVGNTKFEELAPSSQEEAARWMKNRRDAYLGSPRHLFYSLLEGKSKEEGFRLYTDRNNSTTARLPSFNQDLEKSTSVIVYKIEGLVSPGNSPYEKKIAVKNRVEVHYINKRATEDVYRDIGHAVSWLEAKNDFVTVNADGVVLNSHELVASGDMGNARVSNILPLNYQPQHVVQVRTENQITADRLFETVYMQTNKPYFYPGETIWFKGYMNYRIRGMADSLSTILYVDLISSDRKLVESRILKIDSSRASGNIRLSAKLPTGNYLLVAYTNWMKNYGEQYYFMKVLPVLNIYDRPVADVSKSKVKNSQEVELNFNQEKYSVREKVNVTVSLLDENDKPIKGNLSVSVTDAVQVPEVAWSKGEIRSGFTIPAELKLGKEPFSHRVEYGITWNGQFQSGLKKPEESKLTVVRGSFEEVRKVTTAMDGRFSLKDLDIQDSAVYAFQALRGNDSYGKVITLPNEGAYISFNPASFVVPLERQETVQRTLTAEELADAILLKGVEVKSTKLINPEEKMVNVYGKAETVITSEEIASYGSIEQLLRMRAPGFILKHDGVHWIFMSNRLQPARPEHVIEASVEGGNMNKGSSAQIDLPSTEPFFTINNRQIIVSAGETVGDRLMSLVPENIDRIEISSTAASYMGANGGFGLVAVFLKKNGGPDYNKFQKIYVKGYVAPDPFVGPDYTTKSEVVTEDFRSTLYWGNDLRIDSDGHASFSFFTSDHAGPYRIVIEGVTEKGRPVYYSQLMNVAAN